MSKRAEEATKEIYKDGIQLVGRRDRNNNIVIHPETMVGVLRNAAQRGYEQAEKDHALTWEDIKMIYEIFDALDNEHHSTFNMGIQQYFQEALRRFNEWREKK